MSELISHSSATPLYRQIYSLLRGRIVEGEYAPDAALPTEDELVERYGVSRVTVRSALKLLAEEGLVVRQPGKGTFVSPGPLVEETVHRLQGFAELLMAHPDQRMEVMSMESLPASAEVAEQLDIGGGETVLRIRRRHLVRGSIVALAVLYLPYWFGELLTPTDISSTPIYTLIASRTSEKIAKATQRINAIAADEDVAKVLSVVVGTPLLLVRRTTYAHSGRPLEYIKLHHLGHRHELVLELKRDRP